MSTTTVTLAPPLSFGFNYYHETMGYQGRSQAQFVTDLTNIRTLTNHIKCYHNPMDTSGTITNMQYVVAQAKSLGFYVVWECNDDANPQLTAGNWNNYTAAVLVEAAAAQSAGVDEFCIGNEIMGSYSDHSTFFQGTSFVTLLSTLAASVKQVFTGKVSYQEVVNYSPAFSGSGLGNAGIGNLDYIYFDVYDKYNAFQGWCGSIVKTFGSIVRIGEMSCNSYWGSVGGGGLSSFAAITEADWTRELMRRFDTMRYVGVMGYPFTYGDPSPNSQGFGYRITGQDSQWHDIWNYLSGSQQLSYAQYFYDVFPSGDTTFRGDGQVGGGGGEMDCAGNNAGSFADAATSDYVFRGQVKPISGSGSCRLVARYSDVDNYYALDINVGQSQVTVVQRMAGQESTLAQANWPPSYGGAFSESTLGFYNVYDFEIRVAGQDSSTQLAVFFDTFKLYDNTDTTNSGLNAVTFGCKNQGVSCGLLRVVSSAIETGGSGGPSGNPKTINQDVSYRLLLQPTVNTTPDYDIFARLQTVIAQDPFIKPKLTGRWGVAAGGQLPWSQNGVLSTISTDGKHGLMSSPSGGTYMILAQGNFPQTDCTQFVRFIVNHKGDNPGLLFRYQGANAWYCIDYQEGGGLRIRLCQAGEVTVLANKVVKAKLGAVYNLRATIIGHGLSCSLWPAGKAEPIAYMLSTTDNSIAKAGSVGIFGNPASSTPMQYSGYFVCDPMAAPPHNTGGNGNGNGGNTVPGPLPGQVLVNGVSSYLWGTNMPPDYVTNTVRNTPTLQAFVKSGGFTLMRCAIFDQNGNALSDSAVTATAAACKSMNVQMLTILPSDQGLAFNQHILTLLGTSCNLYEFGNEPDWNGGNPTPVATYSAAWNQQIPALRAINGNAAFIGPALGIYDNTNSYTVPWLDSCKSAGVIPDGVSYHIYPCTGSGPNDAAICAPKAPNIGNLTAQMNSVVFQHLGKRVPLCVTEWNIDGSNPPQPYTYGQAFNTAWTTTCLESMAKNGLAMACQFDFASNAGGGYLDLVSTNNDQPQVQYAPMVAEITKYMSAKGGRGNGTISLGNPLPYGLAIFGRSRFGDGVYPNIRPVSGTVPIQYIISLSKYQSAVPISYIIQKANVWPLLVYYLVVPPSDFAINGDGTIIAPDHVTYSPAPVVNRTLIGSPVLQGYRSMTWNYAALQLSEYTKLMGYYNPQNPLVSVTFPDHTGTWVQKRVVMHPPQFGEQQNMMVYTVALTFTRL